MQEQTFLTCYGQQQQERSSGPGITSAAGRSRNVGGSKRRPAARVRGTTSGAAGQVTAAGRTAISKAQLKQTPVPKKKRR